MSKVIINFNKSKVGIYLKHTASEILDMFTILAPYFNDALSGDVGVSVIKNGIYISYCPADELDLKNKVGDPVKGKVSLECLKTGRQVVRVVSRAESVYGMPYVACAMPIKDGNTVVGCVTTTEPVLALEKITNAASHLASSSEELTANIEIITTQSHSLALDANQLGILTTELSRATKNTDEIVSFIKQIAGQTNLLGLNAAIEAARVGEMGKGFGVVAEEVRKLATASSDSVKNITDSLRKMQNSMQMLTTKINNISTNVDSQAKSIEEVSQASQELATLASDLSDAAEKMYQFTN